MLSELDVLAELAFSKLDSVEIELGENVEAVGVRGLIGGKCVWKLELRGEGACCVCASYT